MNKEDVPKYQKISKEISKKILIKFNNEIDAEIASHSVSGEFNMAVTAAVIEDMCIYFIAQAIRYAKHAKMNEEQVKDFIEHIIRQATINLEKYEKIAKAN